MSSGTPGWGWRHTPQSRGSSDSTQTPRFCCSRAGLHERRPGCAKGHFSSQHWAGGEHHRQLPLISGRSDRDASAPLKGSSTARIHVQSIINSGKWLSNNRTFFYKKNTPEHRGGAATVLCWAGAVRTVDFRELGGTTLPDGDRELRLEAVRCLVADTHVPGAGGGDIDRAGGGGAAGPGRGVEQRLAGGERVREGGTVEMVATPGCHPPGPPRGPDHGEVLGFRDDGPRGGHRVQRDPVICVRTRAQERCSRDTPQRHQAGASGRAVIKYGHRESARDEAWVYVHGVTCTMLP